jgi:hypothetical protein
MSNNPMHKAHEAPRLVAHDKTGGLFFDRPRRWEAASGHYAATGAPCVPTLITIHGTSSSNVRRAISLNGQVIGS